MLTEREVGGEQPVAASAPTPSAKARRRRKLPWSFVIAGVAIAGAVVYLVLANTGTSAEFYMTIGELRACHTCSTRVVRVAGNVVTGSIQKNDATQVIHFVIADSAGKMPVVYSGTVPDIFKDGVQVVVEGKLGPDGVFHAQNLLAKCPSKFQSATPPPANT
jgi:cytochrome c-type biogenesis protein CcmE